MHTVASTIQLGDRLTMGCERRWDGSIVTLTGEIDEHFDHRKFIAAVGGGSVVMDLDQVRRITSYGVREWLRALRDLDADYYCFIRCRPAIVAQFNMVAGFACNGELLSFYAPFLCPTCAAEIDVLIDLRKQHSEVAKFEVPLVPCETCGSDAAFDDMPESYFSYVARARCPNPPAHVLSLLEPRPAHGGLPFTVEKEVSGTLTALWISGTLDKRAPLKRLADGLEGEVLVIVSDVKDMTRDGFARFVAFTQAPVSMFLARVGAPFLEGAAADPETTLPPVLSLWLPMRCSSCGHTFESEVGRAAAQAAFAGGHPPFQGPPCPSCQKPSFAEVSPAQAAAALRLRWSEAPREIDRYLRERGETGDQRIALELSPGSASEASGIGDVTFGKYKLVRRLGYGGMAEIFLARQRGPQGFEKKVALKRILPNLCQDEAFVTMFLQEARLAARLSHPNIVQVLDLGQAGDQYFIALEYVRGLDLRSIVRACAAIDAPMPINIACRIMADICSALSAAHNHRDDAGNIAPIVHRDVSPQNILVSTDGVVKLTDFGVAKAADSVHQTDTGSLKGKPSYMSPERILGTCNPLDTRPDVFAVSVVLYECLINDRPFLRENNTATIQAILSEAPPSPSTRRPEITPRLDAIVLRAMAQDENDRYQDARSLQLELEQFLLSGGKSVTSVDVAEWLRSFIDLTRTAPSGPRLPVSFTPTSQRENGQAQTQTVPAPPPGERKNG
jgi:serine/threonine protein kinase